jgi:hypothetical protein
MHKGGKLEWQMQPTPFGSPVFIVRRKVGDVTKGRLVADLRILNKVAVPDAYPLPSQDEVVNC